jgi:DNA-binding NarL/FixJ family response regulator
MGPRILIVDDHSMIRAGVRLLLQIDLGYQDVEEVSSCAELMRELKRKHYTHLLLDIILSDGTILEILPNIANLYPYINIMVFSMQPAAIYSEALKKYGIRYYASKTSPQEYTREMIKDFLKDENPPKNNNAVACNNPFAKLSPRELEVLHYLLRGQRTKNIAGMLNLSTNTISTLKKRIFEKTETQDVKTLTEYAVLYNLNF